MKENNPMSNPIIARKMVKTREENGNTCKGRRWMANRKLKKRLRVKIDEVDRYLSDGWIFLSNRIPF